MKKTILLLAVIILLAVAGYSAEENTAVPPSAGQITFLTGDVEILPFGKKKWEAPVLFQKLQQGDSVRTAKGKAEISFEDKSRITLKENTSIDLTKLKDKDLKGDTIIKLWSGKLRSKFMVTKNLSTLQVQTKHIVAAVKGTDFITEATDADSKVSVLEGIVSMADPLSGKELFIKAGDYASYLSSIMGLPASMSEEEKGEMSSGWDNKSDLPPAEEKKPAPAPKAVEAPAPMPAVAAEPSKTQAGPGGNFGGTFGAVSVDGVTYYMMTLGYELTLGKFGAGFDVRLLWNDDGIKQDDWNNLNRSIENMFKYVRYGLKGEDLYVKLGVINDASLGHGFLVRRYSNVGIDIYTRRFGTELDLNLGGFGIETITNDITWERFYAGRGYLNLIPNFLHVGVTGVYDSDPSKDKSTLSGGVLTPLPRTESVVAYGADIGISLIKTDLLSVLVYADWARYRNHGEGSAAPGVAGKLAMFDYRLEYRILDADFIPNLFDQLYEERRPIVWTDPVYIGDGTKKKGTYGELTWNFGTVFSVTGAFEKLDGFNPYVRAEALYKGNYIPKLSEAAVGFEQKNAGIITLRDPSAVAYARVGVDFAPGVVMMLMMKQTYDPLIDDYKRSTIMAMQLKF